MLNDVKYQIGRGYFSKTAYWYFGLAKSHGKVYVGVCWYSPAASDNHDTHAVVCRLDWNGQTIAAKPVRQLPDVRSSRAIPLLLDTLSRGDLVLSAGGELWRMNEKGAWSLLAIKWLKKYPQLAAYSLIWRRGPWLLTGHQQESGKVITFHVDVQEAATRRKVREFQWSVYP